MGLAHARPNNTLCVKIHTCVLVRKQVLIPEVCNLNLNGNRHMSFKICVTMELQRVMKDCTKSPPYTWHTLRDLSDKVTDVGVAITNVRAMCKNHQVCNHLQGCI